MRPRSRRRAWRAFGPRDRETIAAQLDGGAMARCPRCGSALESRHRTRLSAVIPGEIEGRDLQCRGCRLFDPHVRHTERSIYLLRVRRLAAAVLRA